MMGTKFTNWGLNNWRELTVFRHGGCYRTLKGVDVSFVPCRRNGRERIDKKQEPG